MAAPANSELHGAVKFEARAVEASEYLPNQGVFLAGMLGKARGDGLGFYFGRMKPGCAISREIHPETSETVYILSGRALGRVEDQEVPLGPGEVLHIDRNVHHGLENVGDVELEFLVIGHPDF
jgi:mannose-6-phosphate isomerase-like protein (cupin superfamily)